MTPSTTQFGCLLLDGARYPDVFAWLERHWPEHTPYPLLRGSDYEAIADTGPLLLAAPQGEAIHTAWSKGADFADALWLESSVPAAELCKTLQRRLRILTPNGRELWLRLADARPMRAAWQRQVAWPEGFWHQVQAVWAVQEQQPACLWRNAQPNLDAAPNDADLRAQITLAWPLLHALGIPPEEN